jgi:hypothetical protein
MLREETKSNLRNASAHPWAAEDPACGPSVKRSSIPSCCRSHCCDSLRPRIHLAVAHHQHTGFGQAADVLAALGSVPGVLGKAHQVRGLLLWHSGLFRLTWLTDWLTRYTSKCLRE